MILAMFSAALSFESYTLSAVASIAREVSCFDNETNELSMATIFCVNMKGEENDKINKTERTKEIYLCNGCIHDIDRMLIAGVAYQFKTIQ